jgi:hypothetical protein
MDYSVVAEIAVDHTNEVVRETLAYTRFAIDVSGMSKGEAALKAAEYEHEEIRQARALLKTGGGFEFEVELGEISAAELSGSLEWLKERGHMPQFAGVAVGAAGTDDLAEIARLNKVTLSFRYGGQAGAAMESLTKATAGRFNWYVNTVAEAEYLMEYLGG